MSALRRKVKHLFSLLVYYILMEIKPLLLILIIYVPGIVSGALELFSLIVPIP